MDRVDVGEDVETKPQKGILFNSENEAYDFYNSYGVTVRFSIRKGYDHWSNKDTTVMTNRKFVYSKAGSHGKDKRYGLTSKSQVETRTECQARMTIYLIENGKYECRDLVEEHNHEPHVEDIKYIPDTYILRLWTRSARSTIIEDSKGKQIVEYVNLDYTQRYRLLCPQLVKIAVKASKSAKGFDLVKKASKELYEQLQSITKSDNQLDVVPTEVPIVNPILVLKKKKSCKSGKWKKSWVEKQGKKKKSGGPNIIEASPPEPFDEFSVSNMMPISFIEVLLGTYRQALSQLSSSINNTYASF
ncbi:uncharacterized protein LOC122071317 [Macadamia integrifolia]|uniref:uncharacterized protein LOC122071317 n=1 Tax=Macadamia integrifolia TaxID=60698 RepID=UPI001C4EB910|nr:uncharacterized protein LOC122071317 [Macadamia integrifolia]